jgi:hypothetical protein
VYYSCSFSRNSHFNSFWKLIWSFFLTFLPNELIALKTRSPTTLTPQALLAFALVYVAFQFGPRDIAFEFSSETIELFGFLHGFNQFRTFARWLPSPAAFLLGLLDVLVEPGFRVPLKFVEAPGAGVFVVLRTAVVLGVYLAVRLGVGQSKTLDLLFGTALALLNVFTWQTKELLRKAAGRLLRGRNWSPFHVPATGG